MKQQKTEESLILAFEFQKFRPKYKKKDVEDYVMIEEIADTA